MKSNKLLIALALSLVLLASCNKGRYDFDHVQGVDVEGETLLPLATGSFTLMGMMQRFQIDSLIEFDASGNMTYNYFYENFGVVEGSELLKFKDLNYNEHFAFENPIPFVLPNPIDTVLSYEHTLTFEADHIGVVEAEMRSGHFDFNLETNIGAVTRVIIRSTDIKDAQGHDLELVFPLTSNSFGFDLDGLHYVTETPNMLNLSYELYFSMTGSTDDELYFDIDITGNELAIKKMTGYVESYGTRSHMDTVFSLFPDNVSGMLQVNDVNIRLRERNTFNLEARLDIDTAMVTCEGIMPFSVFEPLPLVIDLPTQMDFNEVFSQNVDGRINAAGGRTFASSNFIINPNGISDLVSVADTCGIDVRVDVAIPMAFRVSDVHYLDTVNLNIAEIKTPEWVKKLTLELTFISTIPFDLSGRFLMYNSETEQVTDVLIDDATLIAASYDGQATTSNITVEVTEERLQNLLKSNRIILDLQLDTDGRNVVLNGNQSLQFFTKAKAEYDGVVEFDK